MKLLFTAGFALLLPLIIIWSLTTPTKEMSLAWRLAVIDAGTQVSENHPTVSEFDPLLDSLGIKCSNSRAEIAQICITTHAFLRERGSLLTLLEFTQKVDKAIPIDLDFKTDIKEVVRAMAGE